MKYDTKILNNLSSMQQLAISIRESLDLSSYYYSALLSESIRVRDMLKMINEDSEVSEDIRSMINDCWFILDRATKNLYDYNKKGN